MIIMNGVAYAALTDFLTVVNVESHKKCYCKNGIKIIKFTRFL